MYYCNDCNEFSESKWSDELYTEVCTVCGSENIKRSYEKENDMENLEIAAQETKELVIVKQLPIIEEHLKELAIEVDEKVATAKALVCTEDTVKDVKATRTELNKQFEVLEESRKSVKKAVLSPYEQFEKVYKECVSDKFKKADADLKKKIDEVENGVKAEKENTVKEYFTELLTANQIDFVTYAQAKINVTLTASLKSLKTQAKEFIDRIASDLALIETQEHKSEILVEYKTSLNVSQAIQTITTRKKAIEEEQKKHEAQEAEKLRKGEERKQREAEREVQKPIYHTPLQAPTVEPIKAPLTAPIEVKEEPIHSTAFKVYGTLEQLKSVKTFLEERGLRYE